MVYGTAQAPIEAVNALVEEALGVLPRLCPLVGLTIGAAGPLRSFPFRSRRLRGLADCRAA